MQYNIDFEISALVVLLVTIFLLVSGGYASIKRTQIFMTMTILEVVTILFNVFARGSLYYFGSEMFDQIRPFFDLYYAFQYAFPLLLMYYLVCWSGRSLKRQFVWHILFVLPFIVYMEEIVRNFLTHHIYEYHALYGIHQNEALNILNGMVAYCVLYGIAYSLAHPKFNSFAKMTGTAVLGVISGIGVTVQFFMEDVFFADFLVAIDVLVLYYLLQNPSEILDKNTNSLNRNMIDELLQGDVTSGRSFDLLVLALDDFKFVNKTFGIAVGDMMLMQVASFLHTMSQKGVVYRYGSDQFALQLRHGEDNIDGIINLIQERFRHPFITEDVSVMMSTTVSCISFPDDGDTLESLIDVIDYSILFAKKAGKGSIVYARDMDLYALRKEKAIEKAVDLAIEQDTIEVYYQPIYNTEKGCYTSAEALVRIRDDLLGNISPEIFIPIAERNGSIVKMGTMIFEKVCRFISEQNLKDTSIEYIEINVSVVQCMQHNFVELLTDIMEQYGVLPSQINLEVTETAAANSLATLQENVEKLYHKGISFSLDDYGSGYATIGYIHRLPFKIIKLDKLMVWDSFENERAGITLKHTVGMLKELKMHIVAEGVETQEQQARLSNIGCDYLQGWYYSKAIPAEEFAQLIREAC